MSNGDKRTVVAQGPRAKMAISVIFDVVRIEIRCGDEYAAQVAFDDISQRLEAGEGVLISKVP
jgi:hypothetical protein